MTSPIWASRLPHSPHARPQEEEGRNGGKTEGRKEGREKRVGRVQSFDGFAWKKSDHLQIQSHIRFNLSTNIILSLKNTNC